MAKLELMWLSKNSSLHH